jgi:hypothetical protein
VDPPGQPTHMVATQKQGRRFDHGELTGGEASGGVPGIYVTTATSCT